MEVLECYKRALGFVPEGTADAALEDYIVDWANQILADTFDAENAIRRAAGEAELSEPLTVSSPEDEIPYHEILTAKAFPYGMARWIFRDEEDVSGSREYYSLYVAAIAEATPYTVGTVSDVYG